MGVGGSWTCNFDEADGDAKNIGAKCVGATCGDEEPFLGLPCHGALSNKDLSIDLKPFPPSAGKEVECPVYFVPLEDLETLGRLPRRGCASHFEHPLTGEGNANLCRHKDTFDESNTLFVFVSHRWCRPAAGAAGHPDTPDHKKCELIIRASRQMVGQHALVPPGFNVALWIDYCCIDQDTAAMDELHQLDRIMSVCDLMLTPVIDFSHSVWNIKPNEDLFTGYRATAWQEYWQRSWCRVEAMFAAVTPVPDKCRASYFNKGALQNGMRRGRRPHFLYGTKELETHRPPKSLPPLLHSHFEDYAPEKGRLTDENDRALIIQLSTWARARMVPIEQHYDGPTNSLGQPHGQGTYTWKDGMVYEGEFRDGKQDGFGKCTFPDGRIYEGQWEDGKKHGQAHYWFADGGHHFGEWRRDMREGHGELTYPDGVTMYTGEYRRDQRHGTGKLTFADNRTPQDGWWHKGGFVGDALTVRASKSWQSDDSTDTLHQQPCKK